ncbi:MAG: HEAT repeat domain-containing protein [Candidatus Helarchaeota archaeon]
MKEIDKSLLKRLASNDKSEMLSAIEELGDLEDECSTPYLLKTLNDHLNDDEIIESTIWSLNRCTSVEKLSSLLTISNNQVIINVLDALGRRAEKIESSKLLPFMSDKNSEIRAMAIWTLGKVGARETRNEIKKILRDDEDVEVRANAAWALQKFGAREDLPFLKQRLKEEHDELVLYKISDTIQALELPTNILKDKTVVYNCKSFTHECMNILKKEINIKDKYVEIDILEAKNCTIARVCKIKIKKIS